MRFFINLVASLTGVVFCTSALAEDSTKVPPPIPPLVAEVPANADWTVTVQSSLGAKTHTENSTHPDWKLIKVHSTKTGKFKRDLATSEDGTIRELWFVDNLLLWPTASGEVSVNDVRGGIVAAVDDPYPSVVHGFPGTAWIRLEYYAGIATYRKQQAYHYVSEEKEAWIDVGNKLPLAYKNGKTTYRFKFNPPPNAPLTMPPDYQKALDTVRGTTNRH